MGWKKGCGSFSGVSTMPCAGDAAGNKRVGRTLMKLRIPKDSQHLLMPRAGQNALWGERREEKRHLASPSPPSLIFHAAVFPSFSQLFLFLNSQLVFSAFASISEANCSSLYFFHLAQWRNCCVSS